MDCAMRSVHVGAVMSHQAGSPTSEKYHRRRRSFFQTNMAAKGALWSAAEVQCLLEIWADERIQEQLETTHKNSKIFAKIRDYLHARGYHRTIVQCRDKVKKMRLQYLKVRDARRKSDSLPEEKEKFQWYDAVDNIIGFKPHRKPNILELHPGSTSDYDTLYQDTGPASPLSINTQRTSVLPNPPSVCVKWFGPATNQVQTAGLASKIEKEESWEREKKERQYATQIVTKKDVVDVLPVPWREVSWTDATRERLRQEFVSYKLPSKYPVSRVKALLLGPVGSGKSCFVNSIRSTMYKRIVHLPNVGTAASGFTKKLTVYDIHREKGGSPTVLSLCDVMAIGDDNSPGLSFSDALSVIKGHVPRGYKFQPDVPVTDAVSGYVANPSPNEQVHCVLFVLDAFRLTSYPSSLKSTVRRLHSTISELGIPQLVLLTHVDQVCPSVQEDLKYVYFSQIVQDKMQKAAGLVGLPLSYVLPVKNYVSQLTVDCNTDILLLSVLMSILQAVDDTLEDQYSCTPAYSPVDMYNV